MQNLRVLQTFNSSVQKVRMPFAYQDTCTIRKMPLEKMVNYYELHSCRN
jgi:hypothetical protein